MQKIIMKPVENKVFENFINSKYKNPRKTKFRYNAEDFCNILGTWISHTGYRDVSKSVPLINVMTMYRKTLDWFIARNTFTISFDPEYSVYAIRKAMSEDKRVKKWFKDQVDKFNFDSKFTSEHLLIQSIKADPHIGILNPTGFDDYVAERRREYTKTWYYLIEHIKLNKAEAYKIRLMENDSSDWLSF